MPAVTSAGTFLDRPMTAAEGALWLREILHVQGVPANLELYSSHSLKATALSWTAKSCTMSYEERLTQGHRCSPKHGMALLYSRNALAEILTKVARVVRAIQRGDFAPDLPRAERVARALSEEPGAAMPPPKMHLSRSCLTHCRRDASAPTRRTGSSALSLTRESADSSAANRAGSGSTAAITRAATQTSPLSSASTERVRDARRRPTQCLLD